MTTEAKRGQFFAAPPMAEPVLPWRPEYGSIDDPPHSREIGADVYVFTAPDYALSVNSVYAITPEGVIVLDTQLLPRHAEKLLQDIRKRTDKPIRFVSNSHHHPDHILGNELFRNEGAELVSSYFTARLIDSHTFWYLQFLNGVWGGHLPAGYVVPRSTFTRSRTLWLGKEPVQLFEFADSTTISGETVDITVAWLPRQKVLHVADLLMSRMHTFFADGTSVPDWLAQLENLRKLVQDLKPRVIVPGHGLPGDAGLIDAQERYLKAVRRLVMEHCDGGASPLTDEAKDRLRQDIINELPDCGNHLALDISLQLIQLLGPLAFLVGRPGKPRGARIPTLI
ncbi:MAG: MBL fold metallo-hydrolase [Chloroflexi bacterium]|nr:MBL fold metallo-hydrolase [Chloroflexota bacterium]